MANLEQQTLLLKEVISYQCRLSLDRKQAIAFFPKALVEFEKVAHISLHVKGEYYHPILEKMVPNDQFYLPENLAQLRKLRLLHLHGGVVQNFPLAVFKQLTHLENLSFTTSQQVDPEDLEALQTASPNCRLNIRMV